MEKYSEIFKIKIVEEKNSGNIAYRQLARKYNVSYSSIYKWCNDENLIKKIKEDKQYFNKKDKELYTQEVIQMNLEEKLIGESKKKSEKTIKENEKNRMLKEKEIEILKKEIEILIKERELLANE